MLKTIRNNNIYRIGDLVLYENGNSLRKIIMTKDIYKDSILCIYFTKLKQSIENKNYKFSSKILFESVLEYIKIHNYKNISNKNDIVLHLRLGDRIEESYKNINNIINEINRISKQQKTNKIVIVSVLNFDESIEKYKYTDNNKKKSLELLKLIISLLKKLKYNVSIISNKNPDLDFCYLCLSNNLVLSGPSGFGYLAKIVRNHIYNYP